MSDHTDESDDRTKSDERPATPKQDDVKTGMHRPGEDPAKQVPAKEGGET
jgi:hypothetical protein